MGKDIEMIKEKAKIFFKLKKKAFISTDHNDYYFCEILNAEDEDYISIESFEGKRRGEKDLVLWWDIKDIQEYRDREANV